MRNLAERPITQEEILAHLHGLLGIAQDEGERLKLVGDLRPILLQEAIRQVQENKSLHDRLNAADRANGKLLRSLDSAFKEVGEMLAINKLLGAERDELQAKLTEAESTIEELRELNKYGRLT